MVKVPGTCDGGSDPHSAGRDPICAKGRAESTHLGRRALASLGILALAAASALAVRQRDLLDPSRLEGPPARAARLLTELQRYGPGDPAALERLVEADPVRARRVIREAIRLAPTWALFRYGEGYALLRAGDLELAEQCFETARRLAPAHSGLAERIGAAWVREALARGEPKLLLYAFAPFRSAAELDPGSLRRTAKLLAPFLPDVLDLEPLVPDGAGPRGVFGILLLEAGHHERAVRELAAAVEGRRGTDPALWLALGRARLRTGDVEGGREALRRAVPASADPSGLLREIYDDFAAAGRKEAGLELWEALAREHPRGARFNLGRHWFETGEGTYRKSFDEFEAVWRLGADPATAGYLARIEIAWRHYRDARVRLERVLRRAPRDADLHYLLARVHHDQGRLDEALEELERAREILPQNELYPRLLDEWRRR